MKNACRENILFSRVETRVFRSSLYAMMQAEYILFEIPTRFDETNSITLSIQVKKLNVGIFHAVFYLDIFLMYFL